MNASTSTVTLLSTTVGKKAVMAVTGVVLCGYVLVHMIGNLQIFGDPAKIDAYAAFLKHTPALLWGTRIIVGLAALVHTYTALQLIFGSLAARPQGYAKKRSLASTLSSQTMKFTGPLLACYAVYHILHLTTGTLHPHFNPERVHRNVVIAFGSPAVAIPYILAMLVLLLHLKHGIWSLFQTLGLNGPRYDRLLRVVSFLAALGIAGGFIAVPAAVLITKYMQASGS